MAHGEAGFQRRAITVPRRKFKGFLTNWTARAWAPIGRLGRTIPKPAPRVWSPLGTLGVLAVKLLSLIGVTMVAAPFCAVYLLFRLAYPRPPLVPSGQRWRRCLERIVRSEGELTGAMRLGLALELAKRMVGSGIWGTCWMVDEALFGRALRKVVVREPVFEISAARSGSTQIARYIEDEPTICAPNALQITAPFLWLWKLSPWLSKLVSEERGIALAMTVPQPEHQERHEADPLRTDTFEIIYLIVHHLGDLFMSLGPAEFQAEFSFGIVAPENRIVWEEDFLRYLDGVARKTLFWGGPEKRLLIRGHFLHVASELERRYPDARFLTVLRAPERRLQSVINFWRCHPTVSPCPHLPWTSVVPAALAVEADYCDVEMRWFSRRDGASRCVVPFDAYVRDLEGTMQKVFQECMDKELPGHVARVHAPRQRSNYSIDRSLAPLGVDETALRERFSAYNLWCREILSGVSPASGVGVPAAGSRSVG